MARVMMRVTGKAYNGMAVGSAFSVSEAQASALEESGKAERIVRADLHAEKPAKAPAKRAYRRRDMKAAD